MPGKALWGRALCSHDWLAALLLLALFLYGGQAGPAPGAGGPAEREAPRPGAAAGLSSPRPQTGAAGPLPGTQPEARPGLVVKGLLPRAPGRHLPALSGRHVVIDPGHGGPDAGAVGVASLPEKAIVLDTARRLQDYLRRYGAHVTLTRTTDALPGGTTAASLAARVEVLRQAGGEIFVSLHADSSPDPRAFGPTTYYHGEASRWLAVAIQEELEVRLGASGLGVRPGNFHVIRAAQVPAVLVEVGFLTHPQEAARLSSPAYRERVAAALADGIARYFASAEPASRGIP